MLFLRIMSLVYWTLLSVLLLVPNPAALVFNLRPVREATEMRGVHFLGFALLALLAHAARWPFSRRLLWTLLVAYALATESLQWLVPHRLVDPLDYAENLLGLAFGAALFWAFRSKPQQTREV